MPRAKALHPRDDSTPTPLANWYAQYQDEHQWVTIEGPGIWKTIYAALTHWKKQHTDPETKQCETETRMTLA